MNSMPDQLISTQTKSEFWSVHLEYAERIAKREVGIPLNEFSNPMCQEQYNDYLTETNHQIEKLFDNEDYYSQWLFLHNLKVK